MGVRLSTGRWSGCLTLSTAAQRLRLVSRPLVTPVECVARTVTRFMPLIGGLVRRRLSTMTPTASCAVATRSLRPKRPWR